MSSQRFSVMTIDSLDGIKLSADVWNATAVPTLLLLTAGAEVRAVWHPVVKSLPAEIKSIWRIVAADHRGHGESGRSESYRFAQFLDDLQSWIAEIRASPLVIAGGSIGGALGMVTAGERANIDGLVLLDVPTVPTFEGVSVERARIRRAHASEHAAVREIDPRFITSGFIEDIFTDIGRWRRAACQISVPTLLIAASKGVITENHLEQYRLHVPHGELAELETSHLVARDDPAGVAELLGEFLVRHFG